MNGFVIVAIVLVVFLGFGIAMGVLIVTALGRRRERGYLEAYDEDDPPPPGTGDTRRAPWPGEDN